MEIWFLETVLWNPRNMKVGVKNRGGREETLGNGAGYLLLLRIFQKH